MPDCNHGPTDRHVYSYYRVYETPIKPARGAPALAEHSVKVLSDIGSHEAEIQALAHSGVIKVASD